MSIEILNSPIFATIQDLGRFGFSHIGLTTSGVMDEYAYFVANRLLHNKIDENIIEIYYSNFLFKVNCDTQIAVTGAYCDIFINEKKQNFTWQIYNLKKGDIVNISKLKAGTIVYLSIKDGIKLKKEFGSYSTSIKEQIGGLNGRKLKKGDILQINSNNLDNTIKRLNEKYYPKYGEEIELRVILSYQEEFFNKKQKQKFFSSEYKITSEFNRMACKLEGEKISCDIDGIVSEAICFGAIQIPKNGQPIILLKERQTIGGYPKIGSVLSIDCFRLSQLKPNMKVKFKQISLKQAQNKLKEFYNSFNL
ncbi:biotin-dependent carboxyltransferase family protein [Arcobacter sp. CECT 8985]|uniref:5-oxoprolinase subunit C family protein n=1 Tax=Arcobacter sp. CECT 8985 TaxID=1935424 RepID=UPI00100B4E30|nr:biotin-dependent carboxyltransferase family protein [Arcobacter sp. CECT 8985]RXJ83612.1 urea amidolyase [Arcobacter sp. CECT 8985]